MMICNLTEILRAHEESSMTNKINMLAIFLVGVLLTGCAGNKTYTVQIHPPIKEESPKQLVLFLDGTQNDRDSRTNIATLSEIIKHQDLDNLYMFYNEGVGTDGRVVGAGTGWGIDKDIAEAYVFLSEYYSPESKLYIFGFSRGSYTSRILAGMIYSVGIYNLNYFRKEDRLNITRELYRAYKGKDKAVDDIKNNAEKIIAKWKGKLPGDKAANVIDRHLNVEIDVMGLWDTVEALGVIPTIEAVKGKLLQIADPQNIINPNGRYLDQVCNIRHVYHALSLDDNRANVFTPIIISSKYVASKCNSPEESSIGKVHEVWFSGAHADVGGGYKKNENNKKGDYRDRDVSISGVSLNWMMSKIKKDAPGLLPEYAKVFANPLGYVHNSENDDFKYALASRNKILDKYKNYSRYGKVKIHSSVFDRLSLTKEERKQIGHDSGWYTSDDFIDCFDFYGNGSYIFRGCSSIERVE